MGTPVKIRDYPRSCKFYSKVVHSEATAGMSGGKAYNRNKSEDLPYKQSSVLSRIQSRTPAHIYYCTVKTPGINAGVCGRRQSVRISFWPVFI